MQTQFRAVFISDVHLGTKACQASHLLSFLRKVETQTLYLVGDIVDLIEMRKRTYFDDEQQQVVQDTQPVGADIKAEKVKIEAISNKEKLPLSKIMRNLLDEGLSNYEDDGTQKRRLLIAEKKGIWASIESLLYLRKLIAKGDERMITEVKKETREILSKAFVLDD